jgi:hypothetical protein
VPHPHPRGPALARLTNPSVLIEQTLGVALAADVPHIVLADRQGLPATELCSYVYQRASFGSFGLQARLWLAAAVKSAINTRRHRIGGRQVAAVVCEHCERVTRMAAFLLELAV